MITAVILVPSMRRVVSAVIATKHDREEMAATMEILDEVRKLRADVEALRGKAPV